MRKIFLSSEAKANGQTAGNYSIDINTSAMNPSKLRLNVASIPYTFYGVNSTNNKIYFDEGTGTLTGTLVPGNYTYTTLATEIKDALEEANLGAKTYTVSYDSVVGKFTITGSAGTTSFLFGTNTESSAYRLLGSDMTDSSASLSITFPNFPVITSPSQIFIRSNALTGILKSKNLINGNMSNVLEVINVNADSGYFIYWENPVEDMYDVAGPLPQNIDITFTDFQGNVLDFRGAENYLEILLA